MMQSRIAIFSDLGWKPNYPTPGPWLVLFPWLVLLTSFGYFRCRLNSYSSSRCHWNLRSRWNWRFLTERKQQK